MIDDDIRSALSQRLICGPFGAKERPALRVHTAKVRYGAHDSKVLQATGWHTDGTPFAFSSAPFYGDAVTRAREAADDLIKVHYGGKMPAPAQIKGLAATLRDALTKATRDAASLGEDAKLAVDELSDAITTGREVVTDVRAATAEVKAALGLNTNGGPSGPLEQ